MLRQSCTCTKHKRRLGQTHEGHSDISHTIVLLCFVQAQLCCNLMAKFDCEQGITCFAVPSPYMPRLSFSPASSVSYAPCNCVSFKNNVQLHFVLTYFCYLPTFHHRYYILHTTYSNCRFYIALYPPKAPQHVLNQLILLRAISES